MWPKNSNNDDEEEDAATVAECRHITGPFWHFENNTSIYWSTDKLGPVLKSGMDLAAPSNSTDVEF